MEVSREFPPCFHRVSIKGLYVRNDKVLLQRESEKLGGKWELPGGGLDFGEDIRLGLEREIKEETGLRVAKMSTSPIYAWTHKFEHKRGLEWFYTFLIAYRIEFDSLDFTPSDECVELGWFSQSEMMNIEMLNAQTSDFSVLFYPADFRAPL